MSKPTQLAKEASDLATSDKLWLIEAACAIRETGIQADDRSSD
jgi:hypothetical protein